jgi:hypothetical protein
LISDRSPPEWTYPFIPEDFIQEIAERYPFSYDLSLAKCYSPSWRGCRKCGNRGRCNDDCMKIYRAYGSIFRLGDMLEPIRVRRLKKAKKSIRKLILDIKSTLEYMGLCET